MEKSKILTEKQDRAKDVIEKLISFKVADNTTLIDQLIDPILPLITEKLQQFNPKCIKPIKKKLISNPILMRIESVNNFLQVCRDLGFSDRDLFSAADLTEKKK